MDSMRDEGQLQQFLTALRTALAPFPIRYTNWPMWYGCGSWLQNWVLSDWF